MHLVALQLRTEVAIGIDNRSRQLRWELSLCKESANRFASPAQRRTSWSVAESGFDARTEAIRIEEIPIRLRGCGETWRHVDSDRLHVPNHLTERGILAANAVRVASRQLAEIDDVAAIHDCLLQESRQDAFHGLLRR